MILKTEETSKGSTCGYALVLFEQAWAHEYQFINILLKYCNISAQPCFHLISALITSPRSAADTHHPNGCTQQKAISGLHQEGWRTASAQAPASGLDLYHWVVGWMVPFTSISWYPTLHHTPDLFPLHFQPPEGRGLVASCPKEETQDLLPNTCPTPLTLQGHKC